MKKILIWIALSIIITPTACKKKTCPAYMTQDEVQKQNDKQMDKNLKKRKHSKARF